MKKIAHLGVDYHIKTVTITVYINDEGFYETVRFKNSDKTIAKYLKKLSKQFEIRLCYEASSRVHGDAHDFMRFYPFW